MRYLKDIKENEHIIGHYMCKQKQNLKTKADKPYISVKLQDKTATVVGKIWDINKDIGDFEEGDVIKIDALMLLYNKEPQVRISRTRKSLQEEYEITELIPSTDKDIDELSNKLQNFIASVQEPCLRRLLELIILEHDTISKAILTHSAAKSMHHSYLGGLLEHTVSVVEICDFLAAHYKSLNRDILITVAILHDIAKVFELEAIPTYNYTDDGQMLGHLYMGAELIAKECEKIADFPPVLESLLKHSILAHHGEYAFGSPKLPMTLEALILHAADNMDAKMQAYEGMLAVDNGGSWKGYHNILERYIRSSDY
ncbi:MAG: HD domain-containing protein [Turicibacter sp.]|nr:HD domain-containing protein [Turicibacter sp.]